MMVAVTIGAIIPTLSNPRFYYWDDTVAAAVPVWQRVGQALTDGRMPFLELDMWRGGNFAAEAATGMWNPVMAGLMVLSQPIDNLVVAITLCKIGLFLVSAGGVYLLARQFGASPWPAALAGSTLPLAGWMLFVDGTAWINGTAISAFAPWAWWALRRAVDRQFSPSSVILAVFTGFVLTSTGNPYAMVVIAIIFLAVAAELLYDRAWRAIAVIMGVGTAILLMSLVVYLPFMGTSSVGVRADSPTFNDEFLSPNLSNLLGLSAPAYKPWINAWGPYLDVPAVYLAWFVMPLLPWLRWRTLVSVPRPTIGLATFGIVFLVLVLGPSNIGMFRWPARLLPFLYLALMVAFVMLLSRGLETTNRRLRLALSGVAIVAGLWMAYSDLTHLWRWQALTTVVVVVLTLLALRAAERPARLYAVLAGGFVLLLGAQVTFSPQFTNVADYNMESSRSTMESDLSDTMVGTTMQVGPIPWVEDPDAPDSKWRDQSMGSLFSTASVEALNAYTGIGFRAFDELLCFTYNGGTCDDAWRTLWRTPDGAGASFADLARIETVVLSEEVGRYEAPNGWSITKENDHVTVYSRDEPFRFEDGRVSHAGEGIAVTSDEQTGNLREEVGFTASGPGERTITFARLAWPGYIATVGDVTIEPEIGPAGLLTVTIPDDVESGTLVIDFTPPGLKLGLVLMALGMVLTGALAFGLASRGRIDRSGALV